MGNKPRFGIGINDERIPSGLMGKTELAAKFEQSIRIPFLDALFRIFRKIIVSPTVLNLLARRGTSFPPQILKQLFDIVGTRVDKRLLGESFGMKKALFGRKGVNRYRSALAGLMIQIFGRYLTDWLARQETRTPVPAHRRNPKPPPKTYSGWKIHRDELQPGWRMYPREGEFVKLLPTDQMSPKERVQRLIQGKDADRVGFGPNWDFAVSYLGGSNIWEFCYDGIATGLASINTHLRLGGSDFLPLSFGVGAYAIPFPDIHSRYFFRYSLPHDAGFPQFLETKLLPSLDALFDHGLVTQLQPITRRTTQDFIVMLREVLYNQRVVDRYFGPIKDQFFPYAEGMVAALDILPMARGLGKFAYDCRKYPDRVSEAFEFYGKPKIDLMIKLAKLMKAKSVLVGCSRGSNTFMSVEKFEATHWPTMKYALDKIIAAGMVPTCHFDNNWTDTMEFFAEKLPKRSCLFHLDQVDLVEVHDRIGDHFCLMGGIDPGTIVLASPTKLERVLQRYIEAIGEDGLILASGCEIPVDVPIQNLYAYKRAISKFGVSKR